MTENKIDRQELRKKIENLLPMPQMVTKLLEVLSNPDSSITTVENLLKTDPDFSVKMLSRANSAFYGVSNKVFNMRHAITLLGFNTIKNLVLQINVSQHFKKQSSIPELSSTDLLKHSVGVAVCAKLLGQRLHFMEAEDLFTLGILHDIGLLIELRFFPEGLTHVLSNLNRESKSLTVLEREFMGIDHTSIVRMICEKWSLPRHLGMILTHHHAPWEAWEEYQQPAAAIYLADKMAMEADYGFSYPRSNEEDMRVLEILKVSGSDVEFLYNKFIEEADKLFVLFKQG